MLRLVLVSLALVALGRAATAADYPQVSDVLTRLANQAAAAKTPPDTPALRLRADLEEFTAKSGQLAPAEAAAQWLALFDRQLPLQGSDDWSGSDGDSAAKTVSANALFQALPGPTQWPALAAAIAQRPAKDGPAARRELALQILAGVLTNDRAALKNLAAKLNGSTPETPRRSRFGRSYGSGQDDQAEFMELLTGEPVGDRRLEDFERQLRQPVQLGLRVPDLVELAGPERAEELLTAALTKGFQQLSFEPNRRTWEQNGKTADLARRVAVREIDRLEAPVWELVDAHSLDLYEALAKKFPESKPKPRGWWSRLMGTDVDDDGAQWARNRAKSNYLAGLILAGRFDDAKAFLAQQPATADAVSPDLDFAELEKAGRLGDVYEFLRGLVEADPKSDYSSLYVDCADRLGKTAEVLPVLRAALDREGLSADDQGNLRRLLKQSLLATGQIDEAVVVLRALRDAPSDADVDYYDGTPSSLLELATLGKLLGRPELVEEGLRVAREQLDKPRDDPNDRSNAESLAALLVAQGRGPEAAELLVEQLGRTLAAPSDDEGGRSYRVRSLLVELLGVYHDAGRHADVIALLEQSPDWGAGDLLELHSESDDGGRSLAFLAASSLAATGRRDVAGKLLDDVLNRRPGYDPAYKLLVDLAATPEQALARLDARFALDAFEERPLIWKADVLRAAGRLTEAEAAARQAIAIDPSDGEQPRGDRMRVYAVLAEILTAQGKQQEAEVYHGAVKAVRLAEQADQFLAAGLRGRALELYRQALELFQDAYCIQSRLALQLAEIGDLNGAAVHFRKAFELMPDSFGRVESHCFGCEGAFRGLLAQSIAEEVFARLAETRADKPQVLYLQAYLRQSQGRAAEAVAPLQAAVRLDPDYLNAWKELHELSDDALLSPAEGEAAVLNLVRLDPGMRHSRYSLWRVRDLAGLWNALSASASRLPKPPAALFELPAAKAKQAQQPREDIGEVDVSYDNTAAATPAEALLQTAALSIVERLLDTR